MISSDRTLELITAADALIDFGRDLEANAPDLFPAYRDAAETLANVIIAAFQRDCADSIEVVSVMQNLADICTYTPAEQGVADTG